MVLFDQFRGQASHEAIISSHSFISGHQGVVQTRAVPEIHKSCRSKDHVLLKASSSLPKNSRLIRSAPNANQARLKVGGVDAGLLVAYSERLVPASPANFKTSTRTKVNARHTIICRGYPTTNDALDQSSGITSLHILTWSLCGLVYCKPDQSLGGN